MLDAPWTRSFCARHSDRRISCSITWPPVMSSPRCGHRSRHSRCSRQPDGDAMNALDLIKQDHKRLKKLLESTLEAKEHEREARMEHLRTELVAHERMEEEVLYPRL